LEFWLSIASQDKEKQAGSAEDENATHESTRVSQCSDVRGIRNGEAKWQRHYRDLCGREVPCGRMSVAHPRQFVIASVEYKSKLGTEGTRSSVGCGAVREWERAARVSTPPVTFPVFYHVVAYALFTIPPTHSASNGSLLYMGSIYPALPSRFRTHYSR
jgi:hypothetical protein